MHHQQATRSERGFSLATVLVIALVSTLFISAMFSSVIPSIGNIRNGRIKTALRSSSEAALDWAVNTLSTTGSSIDDTSYDGKAAGPFTVPTQTIGNFGYPVTATVTVNNTQPATTSYLYDPALAFGVAGNGIASNGWRVVTATATSGGHAETVRVVLKPNFTPANATWNLGALRAKGSFTATGNQTVDVYNSAVDLMATNLFTDKTVGKGKSGGDVSAEGNVSLSGNVVLGGNLLYNGTYTSSGSSTVEGNKSQGNPPDPPPTPPHPAGATLLSPISLSGNKSQTISSGDYYILGSGNGISMSGNAVVNLSIVNDTPVRIWVEGSNPQISISGNGFANSTHKPKNLQIFFGGTSKVSISGNGDFKGVMYAPGADVHMSGNGQIYGALVGNNITLSGGGSKGGFHYDQALGNVAFPLTTSTLNNLQAVSWQEL